ncbi:relaxase domain-containing protein [Acidithiobacillus ferrooxidans]|uniref:MobF family relaxase n=1 Tax=Acidithiobacillus ferrooxidans TaxID=920 RepID=UPI001C06C843|nr:MobF family relaxase [Acidithiobacillus ferrooxidans]MBU2856936.1 relaxase domain-containing protein [Acidithiobacillus ferrooxidans]
MLNVKSLKGAAAAIAGYLTKNQERQGEKGYYQKSESAPSRWQGRGAEMLGLKGSVDAKKFMELLESGPDGMPPATADRRKGADLTWSVPKSVSMLIEAAPPEMRERLLGLCREANAVVVQHIEDHIVTARYGKGGAVSEKTGCAIIATFEHDDARPTPDANGNLKIDPDIHFHNALINATRDADGWRSVDLDMGALSVEQHLADFKAKAFLAAGLQKMGIATEKTRDGFEVAGITREQILAFSDRSKEIEKSIADKGLTRETSTAAERNVANLDTRQNKLRDKSQIDLRYEWHERLRAEGVEFQKLYDPQRDAREISKSGQDSPEKSPDFTTEALPSSTHPEKELQNGQFIKHTEEELHPFNPELAAGNHLRNLSECRLDAVEKRQGAGFLQSDARPGGSENHDLRREPAAEAGRGGLTEETEKQARAAIDAALDHLSEKDSLFDRRQLALEAIKQGMGEVSGADIEAAMATHSRIVWAGEQTKEIEQKKVGKDGESYIKKTQIKAEMVTTVETVAREGWLQGFCQEGRGKLSPLMSDSDAQKAVEKAQRAQGFLFADDQRQAVIATLTSEDRVSAMIGGAGTGKTTAMKSMVDAARSMGFETVGLTPSHGARQELLDAGTDKNVTTASFLMQKTKEDQKPRLYILDESGMVGDRTMQSVLQKMGPRDRILLSGDPDQMKPVEAGDPLQTLADKGVVHVARLTQVQRQAKAEDKDLLKLGQAWADRDTAKALDLVKKYIREAKPEATGKLDKDGKPTITKEDRRRAIADATVTEYLGRSDTDRERTMIICPTNDVRGLINAGIREKLQESGALPGSAVTVTQLTKTALTATHMKQAHQYEPGQIMRTKEGKGAEAHAVDYEVVKADGQHNRLTLKGKDGTERVIDAGKIDPKKWQCFDQKPGMGLAVGEKLVIRDNSQKGAQNGDGGTVTSIKDGQITMLMDRGQTVVLDSKQALAVDYGYARTVNDSQGKSVDLPIMTGEASAGSSRNLLLVGTTRMRHGLVVITDYMAGLLKRSEEFADKNLAETARKNADVKSDRRLDRLDSILEKGKEQGSKDVEKQLNPVPEKSPEKAPEREEKQEKEQERQQLEQERQREHELGR